MAQFKKARTEQAKFKLGLYGEQGSGKTLTSLLYAEGLAAKDGKRIAYIDTERGTDFYAIDIPERTVHPKAFDFDRIITRSITETVEAVQTLDTSVYGVLVLDSITHLWEAAREAYGGKRLANGAIPIQAWGQIKRPYKQLMQLFLDGNFHAILCGREGLKMEKDEISGESEVTGVKMKAEGETPYEPHILGRMFAEREKNGAFTINSFFEKDRSGILTGKTIKFPNYQTIEPIINYLSGGEQGVVGSIDDAAERDQAALAQQEERAATDRKFTFETIRKALIDAGDIDNLRSAWDLTKGKKTKLGDEYFSQLELIKSTRKQELMGVEA